MNAPDEKDAMPARLREAIDDLPREVQPAADLWPGIRAAIEAERVHALPAPGARGRRMVPLRAAAAAALLVAATAGGLAWWARTPPDAELAPVATLPGPAVSFASYERSAAELADLYARRAGNLDPETREVLERSMRTIDAALDDAREALARDPNSAYIREFVESAWRHKLDFLRRANDVAALREL